MAIVRNSIRVSRLEGELSPGSRDSMSSDEEEFQRRSSPSGSDDSVGDEDDDCEDDDDDDDDDSGAGSDDLDSSEVGELDAEMCQVGNQSCSVPTELYELQDLMEVLSVDVWNECLTEDERFSLSEYLPDMDEKTFMRTLKELFTGQNFHFGSPLAKLFTMLKGGLCEPRVALYRQGFNLFQKRGHYHSLCKYQNSMVTSLVQMTDVWANCKGYSIEERLRILNIRRSQKSLMYENMEDVGVEAGAYERGEPSEGLWVKRLKDTRVGLKTGRRAEYAATPSVDVKYGQHNKKGTSKLAGLKVPSVQGSGRTPVSHNRVGTKSRPYNTNMVSPWHDGLENPSYEITLQRDWSAARGSTMAKSKHGKKHGYSKNEDDFATDGFMGEPLELKNIHHFHGRNGNMNPMVDGENLTGRQADDRFTNGRPVKRSKYLGMLQQFGLEGQMNTVKGQTQHMSRKGQVDWTAESRAFRNKRAQEALSMGQPGRFDDCGVGNKKRKMGLEFHASENNAKPPPKGKSYVAQTNSTYVDPGGMDTFTQSEETESDSSEEVDDEEDYNPYQKKLGFGGKSLVSLSGPKKKDKQLYMPKGKSKACDPSHSHNQAFHTLQGNVLSNSAILSDDDRKVTQKTAKNGYLQSEQGERMHLSSSKLSPAERKRKGKVNHGDLVPEEDDYIVDNKLRRKSQNSEPLMCERHEKTHMSLPVCNSVTETRKGDGDVTSVDGLEGSDNLDSDAHRQIDDLSSIKRRGKRKSESETSPLATVATESLVSERELADIEPDTKPVKKPFTLITPTLHSGFSFSIVHLLTAVRTALITPFSDDLSEIGRLLESNDWRQKTNTQEDHHKGMDVDISEQMGAKNLPSLTVQEIDSRVRSNPGDPCILETQEPLQDLIRGVLKLFSSKTAPLGVKGWKALVAHERSTKSWSWTGPVAPTSSDPDALEEQTSSEAWGLPHKMLVKLVDSFANWLKCVQETLKQIGSLPAPPVAMMQPNMDEKERFRDLRAQKSLTTISPSSEEVRAYFHKEEVLRYLVPDRAFSYTAADGRKSTVAPLRRGGGKPTSKARDHFMLKIDRPPHVTILCLVRDAASRLPGSIGTRADVCTLIRDSQYIVESVTDAQVNQVVSGALDRLHYERDPCVQFDGDKKLWVYLHREREEEDFEDDATASTKKWRRQKKDPSDPSDPATVTNASQGSGEHIVDEPAAGYEPYTDFSVDPSSMYGMEGAQSVHNDFRSNAVEENDKTFVGSVLSSVRHGQSVGWDILGLNPLQDNNILCQENSTNEDFGDDTFSRERAVGLLSASLL